MTKRKNNYTLSRKKIKLLTRPLQDILFHMGMQNGSKIGLTRQNFDSRQSYGTSPYFMLKPCICNVLRPRAYMYVTTFYPICSKLQYMEPTCIVCLYYCSYTVAISPGTIPALQCCTVKSLLFSVQHCKGLTRLNQAVDFFFLLSVSVP